MRGVQISLSDSIKYIFIGQGFAKIIAFGDYIAWRHLLNKYRRSIATALEFTILLYTFAFIAIVSLFCYHKLRSRFLP